MRNCWNSKLSRVFIPILFPLSLLAQGEGDVSAARSSVLGLYMFPINPGQMNQLHGTMGELRNNHFHGGLDIRTNNQVGVPVRATQDGYISRIAVSPYSYGNALYVTHPDGRTSLYGHLYQFKGKIASYTKKVQYERKSFSVELNLEPGVLPVNKGDTIAFSGNTGSSDGPHLHFEIREGNEQLNPLKFGFKEILDDIPPSPRKIALRTMDVHSRINDRFGRFEFYLVKKSPKEYVFPAPILAFGHIGIEILADDRMNNSPGRCGINYYEMFVDSQKVFSERIERIDIDESRGILTLMDYKTLETRGRRFNRMYIEEGNRLGFYEPGLDGIISIDDKDRTVRISLKDEAGNQSFASLTLKHNPLSKGMVLPSGRIFSMESDITENILMISSPQCKDSEDISLYVQGKEIRRGFDYSGAGQRVYLIDLREYLPDSVQTCSGKLAFHFKDVVPSTTEYTYYSDRADVVFPEQALYDTLYLNVAHKKDGDKEYFIIGDRTIPLHRSIRVTLRPEEDQQAKGRKAVYRKEGYGYSYLGGEWDGAKVTFESSELGTFTFLADSLGPSISRIRLDRNSARFRIRDNLSGIAYYEANINGQWLLMAYDYKSGILQSDKLDASQPLKGDFELKVVDRAGNERIFKQKIL